MFTGIVTDIGRVRVAEAGGSGRDMRIAIETRFPTAEIPLGASICCAGVCLTVVDRGPGWFAVDVSGETLSKTALSQWRSGSPVNLERALRVGDELGGHLLSGHVDGLATLVERKPEGASLRLVFEVERSLGRFVAPKGSIALDGVSLTVNEVVDRGELTGFGINLIPHTQEMTTLGQAAPGQRVNVEVDLLARYVDRLRQRD